MRRSSILQVLALVAMTIDHFGAVFYPDLVFMRLIGRMALPVFAFSLASGYKITKDLGAYYARIVGLAFLSQIPYMLALDHPGGLNICFTLAASLPIMLALDLKKYLYAISLLVLVLAMNVEYSLYALGMILAFKYLESSKNYLLITLTILTIIYVYETAYFLQIFAIVPFAIIIYFHELKERLTISRRVFYAYYPAHLFVILLIKFMR